MDISIEVYGDNRMEGLQNKFIEGYKYEEQMYNSIEGYKYRRTEV